MTYNVQNPHTVSFEVNYEEVDRLLKAVCIAHNAAQQFVDVDMSKDLSRIETRLRLAMAEMDDRLLGHDDPQDATE